MWLRWLPWRMVLRNLAQSRGLIDPTAILARLESFAQPVELKEPLELLRAGVVFHARGLMNAGAIQHNLDWVWPYWVERQYDPLDESFVPRAFSITHINLTHRNWTAIGIPDCEELPIVDPRGLVTPFWDGWSIDGWVIAEDGRELLPSRETTVDQYLDLQDGMTVVTRCGSQGLAFTSRAEVHGGDSEPCCVVRMRGECDGPGWLVVALRPYNPEGVSFIKELERQPEAAALVIDGERQLRFSARPERVVFSTYRNGDVYQSLRYPSETDESTSVDCNVGMATAAALFRIDGGPDAAVDVSVPLLKSRRRGQRNSAGVSWTSALQGYSRLHVPDGRVQKLYDIAVRSLVLHSPHEVYPGPYTYKRFWFRDAAFILDALLCVGLTTRVSRAIPLFFDRQTRAGFFHSQEGEWDSNGEVLWLLKRYCDLTGHAPDPDWRTPVTRGGRWIRGMRTRASGTEPHAGLMPPGFSAEHLGPSDYYYWDDFWSVAGLRSAAGLLQALGDGETAQDFDREADDLQACIDESLKKVAARLGRPGMPASPYRRMDSGAIGSLAAGYPLRLFPERDVRLLDTVRYLLESSFVHGGFFLDMIHSGINAYLTLHVAQVLLRAGDMRCLPLARTVADLASPTGQWPEAIHPRTLGGCMGDGHHVWAAAEWVLYLRNSFLREEGNKLILASGIPPAWLETRATLSFGPAPTQFGEVIVEVLPRRDSVEVRWQAKWRAEPPEIEVRLPEHARATAAASEESVVVERATAA
ncbi:MAG: hypothetical protein OEY74_02845 [Gammaproteobacteria bacterium]|nr:hypothetical protein [Gammaproteobacteria bacterium]